MNFNNLVLEEISYVYKVLRRATEEEINDYLKRGYTRPEDLKGMWLMHIVEGHEDRNSIVTYIPKKGDKSYTILDPETYSWNWELKQTLSPSTAETFGDIIDEL